MKHILSLVLFIFLSLTKYITCFSFQQNIVAQGTKWHLKSFNKERCFERRFI